MIRRIGEYKGRQELFQKQAPEILENLRHERNGDVLKKLSWQERRKILDGIP